MAILNNVVIFVVTYVMLSVSNNLAFNLKTKFNKISTLIYKKYFISEVSSA